MRKVWAIVSLLLFFVAGSCLADGCLPGEPCYDAPKAVAPATPAPVEATPAAAKKEKTCGWGNRVSAGAPIWFFQEEDTEVGGGIYFDLFSCCHPVNFRVGAEVTHMDADQPNALTAAESPGRHAELTFVRIPFAMEYVVPLAENTEFFIGGGPDILHTANDISETSVGLHLSGRILHQFGQHFGLALEAGYMWGQVDTDAGGDVELDNAFIIPTVSYRF